MIRRSKTVPMLSREPVSGERDVIVRMFLRSYALMEVLYRHASYDKLHAYASYATFFTLSFTGLVLSSVVVMLIVSAYPLGTAHWARSLGTWLLICLALFWAVDRLVDHRIAHIPKGQRPVGIEEFHTSRERLKWVAETIAVVPLAYVLHECMSRIFFS
jgi:hypothetical protein